MSKHKVIIVEDEEYIRESLKTVIDWSSLSCLVSKVFASGEEALEYLKTEKIELVISDIKMDGMSGLEMGRIIRQNYPETRIIFLTGYGDLEKAREAIHHNAWDFLLKPTRPEELMESIRRLTSKLSEDKKQTDYINRLKSSADRAAPMIRQEILKQLYIRAPYHNKEMVRLKDELIRFGHSFSSFHTALVLVITPLTSEYASIIESVSSILSRKLIKSPKKDPPLLAFQNTSLQLIVLLTSAEYEGLSSRLAQTIEKEEGLTIQIGISSCHHSILEVRDSLMEARQALYKSNISFAPFVSYYRSSNSPKNEVESFDIKRIYELKEHLLYRDEARISLLLEDLSDYIEVSNIGISKTRDIVLRLIIQCEEALVKIGQQSFFDVICKDLSELTRSDEMFALLRHAIQLTVYSMSDVVNKRQDELMDSIEKYLLKNYKEIFSITDLAKACSRNEKYLSRYIKKKTGKTFSEYLCRLRIAKAEELLMQTGLSITEIALSVGFNDPAYFSRVFAKFHRCSPRDFRKTIIKL